MASFEIGLISIKSDGLRLIYGNEGIKYSPYLKTFLMRIVLIHFEGNLWLFWRDGQHEVALFYLLKTLTKCVMAGSFVMAEISGDSYIHQKTS